MVFVDTNYFLRFLLRDIKQQAKKAAELFERGALGKIQLFTSTIVFFEVYWVLSSSYAKKKSQVIPLLIDILSMDYIQFENGRLLAETLHIFEKSTLSLVDSFNLVYSQANNASSFATFDKKLSKEYKKLTT
ncbi:PIN domain-containing protein [Candidatus Gottesmanbacteria bacterium]|nr:PIN domain-containing protein [Candidatus Gottesmanbacteria bacterium]